MLRTSIIATLICAPTLAFSQEFEVGPGGIHVEPYEHHHRHFGECRQLRWHCLHKEELGEVGQGNCEAYRRLCSDD